MLDRGILLLLVTGCFLTSAGGLKNCCIIHICGYQWCGEVIGEGYLIKWFGEVIVEGYLIKWCGEVVGEGYLKTKRI